MHAEFHITDREVESAIDTIRSVAENNTAFTITVDSGANQFSHDKEVVERLLDHLRKRSTIIVPKEVDFNDIVDDINL